MSKGVKLSDTLPCPACGHNLNGIFTREAAEPSLPETGDLSICVECRSFLIFTVHDGHYELRLITGEEIAELPDDQRNELIRARRDLNKFVRRKL